jgi:hypothetical protein
MPPDETDSDRVAEAFLDQIAEAGRRPKQFVGARFDGLVLEHAILESSDNHPIDLRHARITGELDWRYAIVRQPLSFEGAIFRDSVRLDEVTFEGDAFFTGARFAPERKAYFVEVAFTRDAIFYDVTFPGDTSFFSATFADRVDLVQTQFEYVNFRKATFESRARFKQARFGHAEFHAATFENGAEFESALLPSSIGFRYASFGGPVRFRDPQTGAESCRVDLRGSSIPGGTLAQAPDGTVVYDLQDATVGAVEPGDGRREGWFDRLHILNTTFDGFDFGRFHEQLAAANWRLHDHGDDIDGQDAATNGQLENTYLKAKNGANEIDDGQAAAEFFRREMLYRRYQYVTQLREGESFRGRASAAWQWTANALLDTTSGYGERPSRVIAFSTAVVVVFTGLFAVTWPVVPYGGNLGYLLLSLESFITLVLGGGVAVEDPLVRLLAQVEGFVGAFLIALFVFTLTRSIHR